MTKKNVELARAQKRQAMERWASDRAAALGLFAVLRDGLNATKYTTVDGNGRERILVRTTRESRRARDDRDAAMVLASLVRRAPTDRTARRLWNRACGFGRGDSMTEEQWQERDDIVRVMLSARRRQALNELVVAWGLATRLAELNKQIASAYAKSKWSRSPPVVPVSKGAKLLDADVYNIIDAAMNLMPRKTPPGRPKRDVTVVRGDRVKKLVAKYVVSSPGIFLPIDWKDRSP